MTDTQIVKFDITEAALTSLAERFANPVVPDTKADYDILKARIKEVRDLRVAIDKERKKQGAAALDHQRAVNAMGNGIIERLKAIEGPMKLAKAEVDEAEERKVREQEEAEEKRLNGINLRIANIEAYGTVSITDTLHDVNARLARVKELDPSVGFDEFAKKAAEAQAKPTRAVGFDEFAKKAAEAQATALLNLTQGADVLKAQASLAIRTKEIEKREAKANAAQAEADEKEAKRKADEQAAEQARLRKLEDEQRDRDVKAEAEELEKRRLEQAPDKEKLMVYAQALRDVELPVLESIAGEALMVAVRGWLKVMTSDIKSEADRL